MADHIIPTEDGKGITFAFIGGDVEFVNPIEYLRDRTIKSRTIFYSKYLALENPTFPAETIERASIRNAKEDWEKHLKEISETEVPQNLISLLKSTSKNEQENLLKGLELTPEMLFAFFFNAFSEFGFTYSQYTSEHFPKTIKKGSLPKFAALDRESGEITKVGDTSLTNGQIKQAIEQRKVIATKFIDNGSDWHAFFITFRSIGGEESWQNGQPHYHYISNKYEISREDAVKQFKSDHYPKTSIHIALLNYGKQPDK